MNGNATNENITREDLAGMLAELRELLAMAERNHQHLEDKGDRLELREAQIARRIDGLEAVQRGRIAELQKSLEETANVLCMMSDTMEIVFSIAERNGWDRNNSGLPLADWLTAVLPNAAAGWPSVN